MFRYIDDFANLFVPNEGLDTPRRILVVLITLAAALLTFLI